MRITSFLTGVAGIMASSPALSLARRTDGWPSACSKDGHAITCSTRRRPADRGAGSQPPRGAAAGPRGADWRDPDAIADVRADCRPRR